MHVSPSQIQMFTDCNRKWGWSYLEGIKFRLPSQIVGEAIHSKIEDYLLHNKIPNPGSDIIQPKGTTRIYDLDAIALNAIENLPMKDSLLEIVGVEEEFEFEINKIKYIGLIDFIWCHENIEYLNIWDHKTSTNPKKWAKTEKQLQIDFQANIYSYYMFRKYSWLKELVFSLNYICTKHNQPNNRKLVSVLMDQDSVEQFIYNKVQPIAEEIWDLKKIKPEVKKLDYNIEMCYQYGGCPYQKNCKLSLGKKFRGANRKDF